MVVCIQIDAFVDVEFALVRPVGTDHPESWPRAAVAAGDVGEVGDDEGLVVGSFALEADAVSAYAVWVQGAPGVDAHVDGIVLGAD